MRTADFRYALPPELIAQTPAVRREGSRLLVLDRRAGHIEHRRFVDLPDYLRPGDALVLNNSRVIPARLRAEKAGGGARLEVLLAEEIAPNDWWVLLRPGKRVRPGTVLLFPPPAPDSHARAAPSQLGSLSAPSVSRAIVEAKNAEGHYRLRFEGPANIKDMLDLLGEVPLPPYITRAGPPTSEDRERYQTVFAHPPGSTAAPTAGLHFTARMIEALRGRGIRVCHVTLHVGLGTFAPVKTERLEDHVMHAEVFDLPQATAETIREARRAGHRVIAVGTTSVRVLESAASRARCDAPGSSAALSLSPGPGRTRIFIHPPYAFRAVDALLTNFHLPESTLLMLVSAFAAPGETRGREMVLAAYQEAIREGYRFYSYGDAMLLL
ncbi:MAG TPA: tRNA preQ1(34) S-adenosylmethionine ribosyltransferase-isomerase QueA [Candidatus Paceibacterota bacterium]|nr:tRNA preQ1(34) S-adenosylmethionine ribosyltransferase-isomerase QueA [Candidatus Paceibacterota bacterium]HRZ54344.1 tRNA preQ1(34) S-adenosylmethionine ribosyltransferase-isomerase QueA [Candidatus Paceibacterota bacterium]